MKKKALITGLTGQDGSYLAEMLLEKGYEVHGLVRRSSSYNFERIEHLLEQDTLTGSNFEIHYGDLSDTSNIINLIKKIEPDEIYNLGAMSHVAVSFESPEYTADIDGLGTLRILEAIRILDLTKKTKFYQASTSELFGKVQEIPQKETTPFYPRSPYAVAKLYSYWITVNYREAYGIYACNGILFNHESPRRGDTFVTRKITKSIANILTGIQKCLYLGNMNAWRDWGHAKDYVEMQWLMLQQKEPVDYVIATGIHITVRDFVKLTCKYVGIELDFKGENENEIGVIKSITKLDGLEYSEDLNIGDVIVRVDKRYYRPTEVETLLGDSSKAREELGWSPKINIVELCSEMIAADLKEARKMKMLKMHK